MEVGIGMMVSGEVTGGSISVVLLTFTVKARVKQIGLHSVTGERQHGYP